TSNVFGLSLSCPGIWSTAASRALGSFVSRWARGPASADVVGGCSLREQARASAQATAAAERSMALSSPATGLLSSDSSADRGERVGWRRKTARRAALRLGLGKRPATRTDETDDGAVRLGQCGGALGGGGHTNRRR